MMYGFTSNDPLAWEGEAVPRLATSMAPKTTLKSLRRITTPNVGAVGRRISGAPRVRRSAHRDR